MTNKKIALVFPGQGSQHVGMASVISKYSPEAAALLQKADDILGFSLSQIMAEGPDEILKKTEYAQPAIFLTSAMYFELVKENNISFDAVAGHSLGEYSALYAAGCLSFEEALKLVRQRGEIMANAALPGEMHAILGLERDNIQDILNQGSFQCNLANHNSKTQIVLSGNGDAIRNCVNALREAFGSEFKVIKLNVSGPFHSALMKEPQNRMEELIRNIEFHTPIVPVLPNVMPSPTRDIEVIRRCLIEQMTGTVNWVDTILTLKEMKMELLYEVGAGEVLQKLSKTIAFRPKCIGLLD